MKRLFKGFLSLICVCLVFNPLCANATEVVRSETQTSISATVGKNSVSYSVEFPQSISLGEITEIKDTYVPYTVKINMENTEGGVLEVTTADEGYFYLDGDETKAPLKFTNTFGTMRFTGSSTVTAYLKVAASDLTNLSAGDYKASLIVSSRYLDEDEAAEEASATTSTKKTTTTDDETNYTAKLSVKKADDFSSTSMCDALFYQNAYITVSDDDAEVTVYVIDPVPNYSSSGTPLSSVKVKGSSKTVKATVDSSNKSTKYFGKSAMFIPTAGNYSADPITFTLPFKDIKNSSSKTVYVSAYVTAMGSTQYFYFVFSDIEEGDTRGDDEDDTEEEETTEETSTTTTSKSSSKASSSTGEKLAEGTYSVKVGALKSNSSEESMMAQYMDSTGDLTVTEDGCSLTVYIQHTVAGKDGGGPKYIKYNGTSATKVSNAKTIGGVSYDSFTIETDNPIDSILPVDMYINAVSMNVSCRITVDLSGIATATDSSEEETIEDSATPLAAEDAAGILGGKIKAKSIFVFVILGIIGAGLLGLVGYLLYLQYKKRNRY